MNIMIMANVKVFPASRKWTVYVDVNWITVTKPLFDKLDLIVSSGSVQGTGDFDSTQLDADSQLNVPEN